MGRTLERLPSVKKSGNEFDSGGGPTLPQNVVRFKPYLGL
jgi:hypothetical protein